MIFFYKASNVSRTLVNRRFSISRFEDLVLITHVRVMDRCLSGASVPKEAKSVICVWSEVVRGLAVRRSWNGERRIWAEKRVHRPLE